MSVCLYGYHTHCNVTCHLGLLVNFDLHGQRNSLFCFTSVYLFNCSAIWLIKLTPEQLRTAIMPVILNKMLNVNLAESYIC